LRGELVVFQYYNNKGKLQNQRALSAYGRFRSRWPFRYLQLATYALVVFFFLIISIIVEVAGNLEKEGDLSVGKCLGRQSYVVAAQGIFFIVVILLLLVFLWKARDAFSIRTELTLLLITCVPVYIVFGVVLVDPSAVPTLKSNWLLLIILAVSISATIVFPLIVAVRERVWALQNTLPSGIRRGTTNSQLDVAAISNDEFFFMCIKNPTLLASFKEFTVVSWCVESIIFYSEVLQYEATESEEGRKGLIPHLRKEYIELASPLEVNIDASTRDRIISAMERGDCSPGLFEEAHKVVYSQLRYDVFPKWIRTGDFRSAYLKSGLKSGSISQASTTGTQKRKAKADTIDSEIHSTFGRSHGKTEAQKFSHEEELLPVSRSHRPSADESSTSKVSADMSS